MVLAFLVLAVKVLASVAVCIGLMGHPNQFKDNKKSTRLFVGIAVVVDNVFAVLKSGIYYSKKLVV